MRVLHLVGATVQYRGSPAGEVRQSPMQSVTYPPRQLPPAGWYADRAGKASTRTPTGVPKALDRCGRRNPGGRGYARRTHHGRQCRVATHNCFHFALKELKPLPWHAACEVGPDLGNRVPEQFLHLLLRQPRHLPRRVLRPARGAPPWPLAGRRRSPCGQSCEPNHTEVISVMIDIIDVSFLSLHHVFEHRLPAGQVDASNSQSGPGVPSTTTLHRQAAVLHGGHMMEVCPNGIPRFAVGLAVSGPDWLLIAFLIWRYIQNVRAS